MNVPSKTLSLQGALATRQSTSTKSRLLRFARNDAGAQKGNALWFILVAIALLGLLTVMMSRSSSTSNETGGYEQNVIAANEILSYAKNMENAVQGLLARGCSENEISFWHDSDGNGTEDGSDDYYNANAPTDHSCHIFEVAGAGMAWETLNQKLLDSTESGNFNYGTYIIDDENTIVDVENNARDELIIMVNWLKQDLCTAINKITQSDATIGEDNGGFSYTNRADGTYGLSLANINFTVSYPAYVGKRSLCFSSEGNGGYHFYHVLHAR